LRIPPGFDLSKLILLAMELVYNPPDPKSRKCATIMRSLINRVFAVAMLAFLPIANYAQRERDTWTSVQPIEVSGQVRITDLGEPARNVSVRLERFSGGIVEEMSTDNLGRFRFAGLQRGYYTVIINAEGFEPVRQNADLQVIFRAYLMFELTRRKAGNPDSSLVVIDARVPGSARDEFTKARVALLDKRARDAVPHLEKALFIYPEFFEAHLLLGTTHMKLREWAKAESTLNRALQIRPDNPAAMLSLGEVYWRQKRSDEAEKTLLEGLKLDDQAWQGYFTLGRLYWDLGNVAKAGSAVGRTLQLRPDFAEAHLLAGNILLHVNQAERALTEYQEYLRLAPKGEFAGQTKELIQKLSKVIAENKK
jgi:Flp pilus assembly protein TadD/5-hydroxyisourate hydrolase-like protein (transthyretin family)